MNGPTSNLRLIVVIATAAVLLIVLFVATGGGFPSVGSPASTPRAVPQAEAPTGKAVSGTVTPHVAHLTGHTWRFTYTVHNTGTVPIAGLQLNGPSANLFHIISPHGWTYYGSGTCSGAAPGVLIYWSTGSGGHTTIPPRASA